MKAELWLLVDGALPPPAARSVTVQSDAAQQADP
jgi:hypothetical protein